MMTRLGRAASKTFWLRALEISWTDFGKTRGSKPRIVGMTGVPFWTNIGDGSVILGKDKIKGAKPSMVGRICSFFEASTPKSTGGSIISSMTTEVRRVGGILHRRSHKYLSQSFLDPIIIALWLVPAWVLCRHGPAAMKLLLHTASLLIQMIP